MISRFRTFLGALTLGVVATACSDAPSPTEMSLVSAKNGVSGGGGGGGGGGGTTAPKPGRIQTASGAASCDAGSSYGITVRKGFNERAELVINAVASPIPTGDPIPPSLFPRTSLGGYTTFTMTNEETGVRMYGHAGNVGASVTGYQQTTLTTTLPPGTTVLRFVWKNQQLETLQIPADLSLIPIHETCTAVVSVFAR